MQAILVMALLLGAASTEEPKPKTTPKEQKQFTWDALPPADGDYKALTSHRFYGPGKIVSIKPDRDKSGRFLVTVIDTSHRTGGVSMKWVTTRVPKRKPFSRWVKLLCRFTVDEQRALRLEKGSRLNVVGTIGNIQIRGGMDWISGGRGKDELIGVELVDVKLR